MWKYKDLVACYPLYTCAMLSDCYVQVYHLPVIWKVTSIIVINFSLNVNGKNPGLIPD